LASPGSARIVFAETGAPFACSPPIVVHSKRRHWWRLRERRSSKERATRFYLDALC
jgi:hypothetical protein